MRALVGRYVVLEILGPFGVFALILLALVWLTQSLRVIETVVNSGQSATLFLEFSALLLPLVLSMVLPVAAFAATLYALNRMLMDSELVVLMAAGMSRLRIARPVAVFGLLVMAAMFVVTLYLMPASNRELRSRIASLGADVAGALLRDGEFVYPAGGVSVYVRQTARDGQMAGLFVQDDRDDASRVTYTAERAALVRDEDGPRLVMFEGVAQRLDRESQSLALLTFDKFVYDLTQLVRDDGERRRKPSEYYANQLVAPTDEMVGDRDRAEFVAEGHEQISAPLYSLALPLIAAASLMGPGFRRREGTKRLGVAIGLAAGCRLLGLAAKSATSSTAFLWPTMYLVPLIAVALAAFVLWRGLPTRTPSAPTVPEPEAA